MMKHLVWLLALAGCAESSADSGLAPFAKPPPTTVATTLTVELASVTLGDDCSPPPPPAAIPASPPVPSAKERPSPARAAPGYRGRCDQTTMQLSIKTPANFKPSIVKIKKVELLDAKGNPLQALAARSPRTWSQGGLYAPWDEKIAAGTTSAVMYDLTAPDWNKLTNGRWNAHSMAFQVRVTVEVGNASKTVTKQSITATRLSPPVPT